MDGVVSYVDVLCELNCIGYCRWLGVESDRDAVRRRSADMKSTFVCDANMENGIVE